eukprot:836429_1
MHLVECLFIQWNHPTKHSKCTAFHHTLTAANNPRPMKDESAKDSEEPPSTPAGTQPLSSEAEVTTTDRQQNTTKEASKATTLSSINIAPIPTDRGSSTRLATF